MVELGQAPDDDILAVPARAGLKRTTHIRSTLLMSSQTTLHEEGLYDRYVSLLPSDRRDDIMQLGAPCWLPLSVGIAHYEACDQLGLSEAKVVAMAQRVAMHREGSFLGVALNIARGAGVTPWSIFKQVPRIWSRGFMGGAVGGTKLGPKELRLEIVGWPCARIPYLRHAMRGLTLGVVKLVSRDAYVKALVADAPDSVCYQVSWV
jgi:hypothetical protein